MESCVGSTSLQNMHPEGEIKSFDGQRLRSRIRSIRFKSVCYPTSTCIDYFFLLLYGSTFGECSFIGMYVTELCTVPCLLVPMLQVKTDRGGNNH